MWVGVEGGVGGCWGLHVDRKGGGCPVYAVYLQLHQQLPTCPFPSSLPHF